MAGPRARTAQPSNLVHLVRHLLLFNMLAGNCYERTTTATVEITSEDRYRFGGGHNEFALFVHYLCTIIALDRVYHERAQVLKCWVG